MTTLLPGGSLLILTPPPRPNPCLGSNLSLNVDCSDSPRLLLHLLHPLGSQIEVGLQVVAGQQQPQDTQGHDDPQAQAVKGGAGNPERRMASQSNCGQSFGKYPQVEEPALTV